MSTLRNLKSNNLLEITKIFKNSYDYVGTKLVNIRFVIEFNVSVDVMNKLSNCSLNSTRIQTIPLFSRYKLLHAEKINRRQEVGGHGFMSSSSSSSGANPTLGHGCPNESSPDSPILRSVPGGEKANVGWFQVSLNSAGPRVCRSPSSPLPVPRLAMNGSV